MTLAVVALTAIYVAAVAAVRRFRAALWVRTSPPVAPSGWDGLGVGWVSGSPEQGSRRLAPSIRRHGLVHHYGMDDSDGDWT